MVPITGKGEEDQRLGERVMTRNTFRFWEKEEEAWKEYRTRTSGLMRRVDKAQATILDGYCCRQDGRPRSTARRTFLEKYVLVEEQECKRDEAQR